MTTTDRILLWITRIGVFLIPFIPLIVSGSMFFPFITGKNFTFRIITEIIFAAWLVLMVRQARFRPKKSALLLSVAAFLGIVLLADLFGENLFKAFWSNFERMEGFITLLHLGAYFLTASSVLESEKLWLRFFATSVGASAFLGIYGILQLTGKIVINQGGVRLDGTFGNAAYFAGYMLFHVFLTLFLIFRHRITPSLKWLYGGALLLQLFTLYFTATRGAAVGLIGGLLLAALLVSVFEKENPRLRRGAIAALVALIAGASLLVAFKEHPFVMHNPVLTRFASISPKEAGPRFMVWGMAFEGFKEHPLLGWGQEGFNYVFNKYYNPNMWGQEQWFDRTHNIFFDWLIAAGLLGLLSYLSLFGCLLWYLWRGTAAGSEPFSLAERSVLSGLLAGYFLHNFFVFDNIGSYLLFFSLLAFMHARYASPAVWLERFSPLTRGSGYYVALSLLALALAGSVYALNLRGLRSARDLIHALKSQPGGPAQNLSFYRSAAQRNTVGSQEVAEQLLQFAVSVAGAQNIPEELRGEVTAFAAKTMEREIERAPNDARLRVFQGVFYNRLGRWSDARKELEGAHALSPAKQTISFELATAYLNIGKNAEALALLREAHLRAPAFLLSRLAYALAAIYAGELVLAGELLAPIEEAAVLDDRVVKAYYDVKRYDKVLGIWQARVEKNPENPQARVSLGAAYLLTGNRAQAIAELQKAIALNPQLKEQAELYIREIRAGRNP